MQRGFRHGLLGRRSDVRALLDINVLLALLDHDHVQHERAKEWLNGEIRHGWASCAITQNGFIRIRSQPSYPGAASPREAAQRLATATATDHHRYWRCDLSILDDTVFDHSRIHGARQVTDLYLLGLAAHHGGRFVTFDRAIAPAAARVARAANLVVL